MACQRSAQNQAWSAGTATTGTISTRPLPWSLPCIAQSSVNRSAITSVDATRPPTSRFLGAYALGPLRIRQLRHPSSPASRDTHGRSCTPQSVERLQRERDRLVADARDERASWQTIAAALGVSRQAAWQAHREGAVVVAQIRSRSNLSDEAAIAVAQSALSDVRCETPD